MSTFERLAQIEKRRVRITAIKAMQLKMHGGQSLVKIETDAGIFGAGEAGASAATMRANLRHFERWLIGQDPLEIDKHFVRLSSHMHSSMAHMPTVSGIDIALWDIAGKILDRPVSTLLSGRYRDDVPLYAIARGRTIGSIAQRAVTGRRRSSPSRPGGKPRRSASSR